MAFDFDDLEELDPGETREANLLAEIDDSVALRLRVLRPGDMVCDAPLKTPWLPHGAETAGATVRLFCFYGAGKQANDFHAWAELACAVCPTEVRVCPVELPGHALHQGVTQCNAHVCAERFVREVVDRLEADGVPFALFGFSIGARIAYEVARRRAPLRFYAAGRAAPHVGATNGMTSVGVLPPDQHKLRNDAVKTMRWATTQWGTPAEQARIEGMVRICESENDFDILNIYAKSIWDDLDIGCTELCDVDLDGRPLDKMLRCRIRVYEAENDISWPPSTIQDTWDEYQAAGRTSKTTYPGLTHDELCAVSGRPLLLDVLSDLSALVRDS